jgi:hypothetical protein
MDNHMRAVEFFNSFNPCSFDARNARQKFINLKLKNKVAVIALTVLVALATVWMLGFGAVPFFRIMVDKLSPKQRCEARYEAYFVPNIRSAPPVPRTPPQPQEKTTPEYDAKTMNLAKRWALKIVPEVMPMAKLPLQIVKSGATVKEAVDCYTNGDYVGLAKKAAPLVVGATAMAYGGPTVAAIGAAYQAYSLAHLAYETVTHATAGAEENQELLQAASF